MRISVNCPSYRRPKVETLDYLPFCKVWVDESELDAYREANQGFESNIIPCASGIQGNLCRIRNHIMKQEFDNGYDVVLMIDDDLKSIGYYESLGQFGYNEIIVQADEFMEFIEKYSIMAMDLGAYLWGLNCVFDNVAYLHYNPFSTVNYIGGPFQCHIKGGDIWYDEELPLKEDYDISLQHLNKFRVCLRLNKFHYHCKQSAQAGGCAVYRNMEREKEQLELLQAKWGSKIVRQDKRKKNGVEVDTLDYNPILRVPIKGV